MLGYMIHDESGDANAVLAEVAARLAAGGLRLAGAVQHNLEAGPGTCDMDLTVLGSDAAPIRISQSLGTMATACRLDSDALARAVGLAGAVLDRGADLVIVNKFGKQEAAGAGFRDLIGRALAAGVPVLTAVPPAQTAAFLAFAGDLAVEVAPEDAAAWCRAHAAAGASA